MRLAGHLFFAIASFAVVSAIYVFAQFMVPTAAIEDSLEVRVNKGSSFATAALNLHNAGLIKDRRLFVALGRLAGIDKKLTPGYYRFYGQPTAWDVFKTIRDGRIVQWQVRILEGDTLIEIKDKLARKGIVPPDEFARLAADDDFISSLGIEGTSLEGYLFPNTYSISKGSTPEEVISLMVATLWATLDDSIYEKAVKLGFSTGDMLTMASIIEREAVLDREREIISGVYHNRLRQGIPLQADPTAIYGVKPYSSGVTLKDLRRRTEYNTYHFKGLPPGPIASPGLKSIKAAINPADVPYLFFVASGNGGHKFSVTLKEHEAAVEDYRNGRRAKAKAALEAKP